MRVRTPQKYNLTQEELDVCPLENMDAEAAALKAAVSAQIDTAMREVKEWMKTSKNLKK
jgi:hypothetical protein|tara:strand:- start:884 stop:1060 length:177 start_codon:yes stop_codon:yes gene_type:complete